MADDIELEWVNIVSEGTLDEAPGPFEIEVPAPEQFYPMHPLMMIEVREGGGWRIDVDKQGTAFFITQTGLFVTAKHVLENGLGYSILLNDLRSRKSAVHPVRHLALHPDFDVAVGSIGPHAVTPYFGLGLGELPEGERLVLMGYPASQYRTEEAGENFAMNYFPRYRPGVVMEYKKELRAGPAYHVEGVVQRGMSGGPVLRLSDEKVYAVISRGMVGQYELVASVASFVDWPIEFLDGKTLRQLGEERPELLHLYP